MSEPTNCTKAEADYNATHAKRWQLSLEWIAPYAEKATKILELGGRSKFTEFLVERWKSKLSAHYDGDLREGVWMQDCDLILAMEVLEHLSDVEPEWEVPREWKGTGTSNFLMGCWNSLKPGGVLFLTTPNPCSVTAIHHALNLAPPMLYRPHVREYSPYELDEMIRGLGFEILKRETHDVWLNAISPRAHARITKFIRDSNYSTDLRGEDIFLLCRKPMRE